MKRNEEIRQLRKEGWTYQRIGEKFMVSRQRVCQIIKDRDYISDGLRYFIYKKHDYTCQLKRKCNGNNNYEDLELHHIDLDPSNSVPSNLTVTCKKCHHELHRLLKDNICEICGDKKYKLNNDRRYGRICIKCYSLIIQKNKRRLSKMWSFKFDKCIKCGTTKIKHYSHGLCIKCYAKIRNNKNKEYLKEYYKNYYLIKKQLKLDKISVDK